MSGPPPTRRGRRIRHRRGDEGEVSLEFVAMLPYLLIAVLAVLQFAFSVTVVQSVSAAARAAARTVSQGDAGGAGDAARSAVPSWMAGTLEVSVGGGADGVQVTAPVPILFPGFNGPSVTRSAWFEPEQEPSPWG